MGPAQIDATGTEAELKPETMKVIFIILIIRVCIKIIRSSGNLVQMQFDFMRLSLYN